MRSTTIVEVSGPTQISWYVAALGYRSPYVKRT
ncbi:Uncharacterised protein [Mycobacterium tuberculosis]|nr:Uncharacterised protein [Mycobacterium tuberculosis]COW74133.1 Uncharacterised protein [Mycobacterium tuberculosis]COX81957.1 Uncharacterised protein [Mycobacterium tuberculosis]